MQVSQAGISLIIAFEGFKATAYQDLVGVWTVGYGSIIDASGKRVTAGTMVTKTEALALLQRDVKHLTTKLVARSNNHWTQGQLDALVSLAYNIGLSRLLKSKLWQRLQAGEPWPAIKANWLLFRKAGGKIIPGLERRRRAEVALFEKG